MAAARLNGLAICRIASVSVACSLMISAGCGSSGDERDQAKNPAASATAPQTSQAAVNSPQEVDAGKRALAEGNYQEAVDRFTRAIAAGGPTEMPSPNAAEAPGYYQRGVAYLKMGFPDTAVQDFAAALNLGPPEGRVYEQRARAYLELGDAYKALRDATQAIRLTPENAAAYQIRGQVYLARSQYDRAVADFEQAIDQQPELAGETTPLLVQAYSKWSDELAREDDDAGAAEKLATARELDPNLDETVAVVILEEPLPVEQTVAKPVIEEADKEFDNGREHQVAQDYDQALIDYTEAIALRPDFDAAYLRRGETLLAMGFPDTALEDLNRAVNRGAKSAEAFRLQAQAHMALDNPHRAAMSATDALHVDPTDAAAYALRGSAYLQLENWDRAIIDLDEAIRRDPSLRATLEPKLTIARREQEEARSPNRQAAAEI